MLIAVETPEHLPEWLCLYRVKPLSGATLPSPPGGHWELHSIWEAMSDEPYPDGGAVSTNCECGFPHDAPSAVSLLSAALVTALAELPADRRWQVALG